MATSPKAIEIFYSYADEDQGWQKKLEQQLRQDGLISHWHHGLIGPGHEQQLEIDSI